MALDPDSGKLKWHFQFTPHDLFDYDATQTPVLVDLPAEGRVRKLLVEANRNGFFYILDRATGNFLGATPFVEKLNWATGIDERGRPIRTGLKPTPLAWIPTPSSCLTSFVGKASSNAAFPGAFVSVSFT
jgi:alcohol dehydrogenase (cytochrome c)